MGPGLSDSRAKPQRLLRKCEVLYCLNSYFCQSFSQEKKHTLTKENLENTVGQKNKIKLPEYISFVSTVYSLLFYFYFSAAIFTYTCIIKLNNLIIGTNFVICF